MAGIFRSRRSISRSFNVLVNCGACDTMSAEIRIVYSTRGGHLPLQQPGIPQFHWCDDVVQASTDWERQPCCS
eukprot:m.117464 g.117464  ORF g.117464 m.117464 type:complete len:73 (+) comp13197_c0_seq1:910-1128(+)